MAGLPSPGVRARCRFSLYFKKPGIATAPEVDKGDPGGLYSTGGGGPMIKSIEHIGIAVNRLEERIPFYRDTLGMPFLGIEDLPERHLRIAAFDCGGVHLELLQSTSPDTAIASFIEKKGEGLHHIALAVDDVRTALASFADSGIKLIDAEPRPGAAGAMIAFLNPNSTGRVLIELVQKKY
jgi:methylmalonyl-CoA/ethylmalonyl-CoA epimerase